jgi:peptidylprolyl isomerase
MIAYRLIFLIIYIMSHVQTGNTIRVHYTGALLDGTVFDSSRDRDPLEFTVGAGMMIKGFDAGVIGLEIGKEVRLEIPAEDAYGDVSEEMLFEVPKDRLPPDLQVEAGMRLTMPTAGGLVPVTVAAVTDTTITLDANHELAGKDLVFDVEVVEIVS